MGRRRGPLTEEERIKNRAHLRARYAKNPQKYRDYVKVWKLRNPEKAAGVKLFAAYGITWEQYAALLSKQLGVCAICSGVTGRGWRLAVDHCHVTGRVRGLLCDRCNRAIGLFKDDSQLLLKAVEYLRREQK